MGVLQSISDQRFGTGAELSSNASSGFVHLPRIAAAPRNHLNNPSTGLHFIDSVPTAIEKNTGRLWAWTGTSSGASNWIGSFYYRGTWDNISGTFNRGDAVRDSDNLYVCSTRHSKGTTSPSDEDSTRWTLMVAGGKPSGLPEMQAKGYLYASSPTAALTWKDLLPAKQLLPSLPNNNTYAGRVLRVNSLSTPSAYWDEVGGFVKAYNLARVTDILSVTGTVDSNNVATNKNYDWVGLTAILQAAVWNSTAYGRSADVLQIHLNTTPADSTSTGGGTIPNRPDIIKIGLKGGSQGQFLQCSQSPSSSGLGGRYRWHAVSWSNISSRPDNRLVPLPTEDDIENSRTYLRATAADTFSWQTGGGSNGGNFNPVGEAGFLKKVAVHPTNAPAGYAWRSITLNDISDYVTPDPPRTLGTNTPATSGDTTGSPGGSATTTVSKSDHKHPMPFVVTNNRRGTAPMIPEGDEIQAGKVLTVDSSGQASRWQQPDRLPIGEQGEILVWCNGSWTAMAPLTGGRVPTCPDPPVGEN